MSTKKLFLVPSDIMHNLQSKQRMEQIEQPEKKIKYDVDEKMNKLLSAKDISDHDKSIIYNQLLQMFLQQHQDRDLQTSQKDKSINVTNLEESITQQKVPEADLAKTSSQQHKSNKSGQPTMEISNILRSMPKMYQRSTENFLEYLTNNSVSWRDDGSLKIQDRVFPGSNIIDIANHLARHRMNRDNPTGTRELIEYLKGINTPNEIIGNKQVWLEHQTPITPPTSSIKQPPKKGKSKRKAAIHAADTVKGWLTYK